MDPLTVAQELVREAGSMLRERIGRELEVEEKSLRGDIVTSADRASEALIVARLRAQFPHSAILAEEGSAQRGDGDDRWIVDPLDGTTNYAHTYPLYCVSVAYERCGDVIAGAIYAPAFDELYAAERGAGATCNGRQIAPSAVPRLADALVCTGFMPARFERNARQFASASRRAQAVRRDGSAALDLAFTACGRFDAFWEFDLNPWDVAAGALLVREAGGAVSAIDGGAFRVEGCSVLATNGRLHEEMVEALKVTPARA